MGDGAGCLYTYQDCAGSSRSWSTRLPSAGLGPTIEHYADGRVDPSGLVDVTVGLSRAAEALAGQISAGSGTKIHIDPGR